VQLDAVPEGFTSLRFKCGSSRVYSGANILFDRKKKSLFDEEKEIKELKIARLLKSLQALFVIIPLPRVLATVGLK
jgi:hypothetical protein